MTFGLKYDPILLPMQRLFMLTVSVDYFFRDAIRERQAMPVKVIRDKMPALKAYRFYYNCHSWISTESNNTACLFQIAMCMALNDSHEKYGIFRGLAKEY
jgi:hypothetical protein